MAHSCVQTRLLYCYSYSYTVFCKHSLSHLLIGFNKKPECLQQRQERKVGFPGRERGTLGESHENLPARQGERRRLGLKEG